MGRDKNNRKDRVYLKDSNNFIILEVDEIEAITYYSLKRESEIHLSSGKKIQVKRKFSEMEKIQERYSNFFKIERGTILNLDLIYCLNYKGSKVIFKSGNTLLLNKQKLKFLEEYLVEEEVMFL